MFRALILFTLFVGFCAISPPAFAGQSRPNILWLSTEDISTHLGCYGDPDAITPALDALAAGGHGRWAYDATTDGRQARRFRLNDTPTDRSPAQAGQGGGSVSVSGVSDSGAVDSNGKTASDSAA